MSAILAAPTLTDRKRLKRKYVSPEELILYQRDPKRDENSGWVAVSSLGRAFAHAVVCRQCGQILASISTVHLRSHRMTQKDYRATWLGAPIYSDRARANVNKAALKYAAGHREGLREYSAGWRRDQKNKPKLKAQGQRAAARRRAHPEPHRSYDRSWYAKHKNRLAAKRSRMKRLKNLEGLDLKTGLRVSLAACLSLEGAKPYAMRNEIYPDSVDPFNAVKKLFANHASIIDAEKLRLAALREEERRIEASNLRSRLRCELKVG